jgi:Fur family zinc uptake transcriptional regulator
MIHSKSINNIDKICQQKGISLTQKRHNIFDVLLSSMIPLSAYDITDIYKNKFGTSMPTMSIYRILEFLTGSGLVHKLESTNKYIACSHLQCDHEHTNAQFLICNSCSEVEEVALTQELHHQIEVGAEQKGFKLEALQFELHGTCKTCLKKQSH